MKIDFRNLKPYVRYSYINTSRAAHNVYNKPLYAYEHRLFYVLEGSITMSIEDRDSFSLKEGDCILFSPGLGYRVLFDGSPSRFVITSFDYDDAFYGTRSIHPDIKEKFREEQVFSRYNPGFWEDVFVCRSALSLQSLLTEICFACSREWEYKFDIASGIMKSVLIELYRLNEQRISNDGKDELYLKIKNYVDSNFTRNVTNQSIGQHFGYHPYYVNGLFRKGFGMTLHSYVTSRRISMAKSLLSQSPLTVEEIAEQCGFSSGTYFAECFKAKTGMTAKEFRKSAAKQFS